MSPGMVAANAETVTKRINRKITSRIESLISKRPLELFLISHLKFEMEEHCSVQPTFLNPFRLDTFSRPIIFSLNVDATKLN